MTFSDTVAQQRDQQEKRLKRFITYSLAGSLALHGVFLLSKVRYWQPEASEPEEIAIIVTESLEQEPIEETPPAEFSEPAPESDLATADTGLVEPGAATFVEAPPAPPVSEPLAEKEPIAEEEPEPQPAVPITEDEIENDLAEEQVEDIAEEPTEEPLAESDEEVAEATPEPRDFSNLLEELRRARQQTRQTRQTATESSTPSSTSGVTPNNPSEAGDRSPTAAIGPTGLSSGSDSSEGSDTGTAPASGAGDDSGQGGQREVRCRGCDFDYPESANGAEGTAQVVVETDEQGRVISVTLSGSSGNPELDQAALEQARERVRLQGARAGESYPIEIDFVQPGSEAAERAEERGDRTSITVSDPEPAAETPELADPATATNQSPEPQPSISPEPGAESPSGAVIETPEPLVTPEGGMAPEPEPSSVSPEATPEATPDAAIETLEPEPALVPELPWEAEPSFETTPDLEPEVPVAPEPIPEVISEPVFPSESLPPSTLPEPVPDLAPLPEAAPESLDNLNQDSPAL
ncbi:MAG: hypothetical protein Kow00121_48270 [Elainellaceae cyanobacterium]